MFSEVGYTCRLFAIGANAGGKSALDFRPTGLKELMNKRPQQILWPSEILAN